MKTVVIPDTITYIGYSAFAYCENLSEVTFSDNITEIGNEAFKNCISLQRVDLPKNLKKLGNAAFKDCVYIRCVSVPKTLDNWGGVAFENNYALSTINFEDGLETIGSYGDFANCMSLKNITIPASVKKIGTEVFFAMISKLKVTFLGDAPEIGPHLFGDRSASYVEIYYDVDASGWDTTPLRDEYRIFPFYPSYKN